jgi:hypothetical protein
LRAALRGEPLPDLPLHDWARVESAAEYAGRYVAAGRGPEGRRPTTDDRRPGTEDQEPKTRGTPDLILVAEGERLYLVREGLRVALEGRGDDTFYVPHPELDSFLLRFERDAGQVAEAAHGPDWYTGPAYAGPTSFAHPPEWDAFPGRYRAHNPWVPGVIVALRKGPLRLIWTSDYDGADGDEQPLVPLPGGGFRIGADERGPERARFDTIVEGRALRLVLSGSPMYRV